MKFQHKLSGAILDFEARTFQTRPECTPQIMAMTWSIEKIRDSDDWELIVEVREPWTPLQPANITEKPAGLKYDDGKPALGFLPAWALITEYHTVNMLVEDLLGGEFSAAMRYLLELLPNGLNDVATVLEFGAKKYRPNSWQAVRPPARYLHAALRHLVDTDTDGYPVARGPEDLDPETGLPHYAHAACCAMFLHHIVNVEGIDLWTTKS